MFAVWNIDSCYVFKSKFNNQHGKVKHTDLLNYKKKLIVFLKLFGLRIKIIIYNLGTKKRKLFNS